MTDAFGLFETDDENEAVLYEAARILSASGHLGLKVVNGAPILEAFRETDCEERDGAAVAISRTLTLEPARMTERIRISGIRGDGEYERRQRLYRVDELRDALGRAGLSAVGVFGSPEGAAFEPAGSSTM